eukprot:6194785-Pleurochrysis_carterae.AAC.2
MPAVVARHHLSTAFDPLLKVLDHGCIYAGTKTGTYLLAPLSTCCWLERRVCCAGIGSILRNVLGGLKMATNRVCPITNDKSEDSHTPLRARAGVVAVHKQLERELHENFFRASLHLLSCPLFEYNLGECQGLKCANWGGHVGSGEVSCCRPNPAVPMLQSGSLNLQAAAASCSAQQYVRLRDRNVAHRSMLSVRMTDV